MNGLKTFGRVAGDLLQIVGAALAISFFFAGMHRAAGFCMLLHFVGDASRKFIEIPDTNSVLAAANSFTKLRPFLTYVGFILMLIGKFCSIDLTLGHAHVVTSTGIFIAGFSVAMIGALNYPVIYQSTDPV